MLEIRRVYVIKIKESKKKLDGLRCGIIISLERSLMLCECECKTKFMKILQLLHNIINIKAFINHCFIYHPNFPVLLPKLTEGYLRNWVMQNK